MESNEVVMFTRWAKATCWLAIYRPCHGTPPHVYYKREAEVNGGDRAPVLNVCPHVDDDPVAWMDDEDKEKRKKHSHKRRDVCSSNSLSFLRVSLCEDLSTAYVASHLHSKRKGKRLFILASFPHRKKKNFLLPPSGGGKKEHCLWQRPTQTPCGVV